MARKRVYDGVNMYKSHFKNDETKRYDNQRSSPFSNLKLKFVFENSFL